MIKTVDDQLAVIERFKALVPQTDWHEEHQALALRWLEMAPEKTRRYGVECWQVLGTKGLFANLNEIYFRWEQLRTQENTEADLEDVVLDAVGYAMLLAMAVRPDRATFPPFDGDFTARQCWILLKDLLWDNPMKGRQEHAVGLAFEMAWAFLRGGRPIET